MKFMNKSNPVKRLVTITECPFGGILKHIRESAKLAMSEGLELIFIFPENITTRYWTTESNIIQSISMLWTVIRCPMERNYFKTWSNAVSLRETLNRIWLEDTLVISHGHCAGRIMRMAISRYPRVWRHYHMPHCLWCNSNRLNPFHRIMQFIFEWILKNEVDGIIACSQSERKYLLNFWVKLGHVRYSPNFIFTENPGKNTDTEQIQRLKGIVIVSRMVQNKGIEEILETLRFSELAEQTIIIWDGPMLGYLKSNYPEFKYLWNIQNEEITNFIENRIFISNSPYEGLSYGLLEAMENSAIPLVRNAPWLKDAICDGVNGFLFDNMDEMLSKLNVLLSLPENDIGKFQNLVKKTAQWMNLQGMKIWKKIFLK